ncbi:FliH/SctL family protein [Kineococcus terrestris]|uniref:FliH/SctL family protein n=1 Tax=Kineococcus terrestris TaxID=2044856 RepID=UPI0034DB5C19
MTSSPDPRAARRFAAGPAAAATGAVRSRAFVPADTAPARAPRTFVAAPASPGAGVPQRFTGFQVPRGPGDEEAARAQREAARAAGYAEGWAEGMRQASERAAAERLAERQASRASAAAHEAHRAQVLARAEGALLDAADAVRAEREPTVGALADTVLELALDLAGAVLDREVSLASSPVLEAVQRALRPLDATRPVTVRLHPQDLDALTGPEGPGAHHPSGAALKGPDGGADAQLVTYLPDPTLQPGDALARQGDTEVDAGLRASVARALEALVSPEAAARSEVPGRAR